MDHLITAAFLAVCIAIIICGLWDADQEEDRRP